MIRDKEHYDLLDVRTDASPADIELSYKKLTYVRNGDSNEEDATFSIGAKEAYDTLSNSKNRLEYDKYGSKPPPDEMQIDWAAFENLAGPYFGGGDGCGRPHGLEKMPAMVEDVWISLEDVYLGGKVKVFLSKDIICNVCDGIKGADESQCLYCHGKGRLNRKTFQSSCKILEGERLSCFWCQGLGRVIGVKNRCDKCHGKRVVRKDIFLTVLIPAGIYSGSTITLEEQGNQFPGRTAGDLQLIVKQEEHPLWGRCEKFPNNLKIGVEVDILTAWAGGTIYLRHLDKEAKYIKVPASRPLSPYIGKKVIGLGIPSNRYVQSDGDLFLDITILVPEKFTPEQLRHLELALPPRMVSETIATTHELVDMM